MLTISNFQRGIFIRNFVFYLLLRFTLIQSHSLLNKFMHKQNANQSILHHHRDRHGGHGRHDFIDVPLSQPALSPNFNLMDHENRCIKYNPLQHQNQ